MNTRFAPSPSGRMHAGNIFAALVSWLIAKSTDGEVILRIEDLDRERSKQEYIDAIFKDFEQLGLTWDKGPYYQHNRDEAYEVAYEFLASKGLIYPCFCTRREVVSSAPHFGEKQVYAGTCKHLNVERIQEKLQKRVPSQRLMVTDTIISYADLFQGTYSQNLSTECGDFIIKRADGAFAYQLAVVVDDAEQGIDCVSRGIDLQCSTPQQCYLYDILEKQRPSFAHFPLLVSQENKRLSKRDKSASMDAMLESYGSPEGIIGHIAFIGGLQDSDIPCKPEDLLADFDIERSAQIYRSVIQIQWH